MVFHVGDLLTVLQKDLEDRNHVHVDGVRQRLRTATTSGPGNQGVRVPVFVLGPQCSASSRKKLPPPSPELRLHDPGAAAFLVTDYPLHWRWRLLLPPSSYPEASETHCSSWSGCRRVHCSHSVNSQLIFCGIAARKFRTYSGIAIIARALRSRVTTC
jgi:hypothetical protein